MIEKKFKKKICYSRDVKLTEIKLEILVEEKIIYINTYIESLIKNSHFSHSS